MLKLIQTGSWDRIEEPAMSIIPVTRYGLTSNDKRDFIHKRASSDKFISSINDIELKDGDVPIHTIAIGATEKYGCNRNGDGFCEDTCKQTHNSFVKNGKLYQHHKSKPTDKSYGKVASSFYNDDMSRIELLIIGNGTKEAAARNGGEVMPDDLMTKLANDEQIATSMGCRVKYDVCNICGHKSASPREYCTEETCIHPVTKERYPGCKHGLTKFGADGLQVFVENPNSDFYDISQVTIPADRTAYGCKLPTSLFKTAAFDQKIAEMPYTPGGAELAEMYGFYINMTQTDDRFSNIRNQIVKMAAERDNISEEQYKLLGFIQCRAPQTEKLAEMLNTLDTRTKWQNIMSLASNGVILSPENFTRVVYKTGEARQLRNYLQNIYNKTASSLFPETIATKLPHLFSDNNNNLNYKFGSFVRQECITPENMERRLHMAVVNTEPLNTKTANVQYDDNMDKLAELYTIYKAAAILRVPEKDRNFVTLVTLCDDFVL